MPLVGRLWGSLGNTAGIVALMLAVLTTHPIQYQTPLWQALAAQGRVPFEVWYLSEHGVRESLDPEFARSFAWDLDLLSGYPHRFLDVVPGGTPGRFWSCRLRERLTYRLRSRQIKWLWIQGWQVAAYWQAIRQAESSGVAVWMRGESNDLAPVPFWKRPLKQVQLRWLFRRVDYFLCIGSANQRLYMKYGVPPARLRVAPYAVDNDRFVRQAAAIRGQRAELRRKWAIPEDSFCVLFCGKLVKKKRPMDLIAAAERLLGAHRIPRMHLLFVGSGVLSAQLEESCDIAFHHQGSEYAVSPRSALRPLASFAGFLNQSEISSAYVVADCLVLPSDSGETWGLVVNEALASGLPCAVSRACGCAEDLSTTPCCRSFELGDIAAMADILEGFHRSPPQEIEKTRCVEQLPSYLDTIATVEELSGSSRWYA